MFVITLGSHLKSYQKSICNRAVCPSCQQHHILRHFGLSIFEIFFCLSFFSFSFLFDAVIDLLLGLLVVKKTSKIASSRQAIFTMEQPGEVAGNFALSFSLNFFSIFLHNLSTAPFGRSLWSGHHWKDLFLLQKLSIDDANFGQKWWR